MVEQEFKSVYTGDAVESVEMVKDLGELLPFVEEYNSMKLDLEDYLDELDNRISKGIKVKRKKVWFVAGNTERVLELSVESESRSCRDLFMCIFMQFRTASNQ